MRAVVANISGKKELTGKNDIETDISNQCWRLISNTIIYYITFTETTGSRR
nr:hypothetical protein [Buttiauxella noackiae]